MVAEGTSTPIKIGPIVASTPREPGQTRVNRRPIPDDMLRAASRRLGVMSLLAAVLWTLGTVFGHLLPNPNAHGESSAVPDTITVLVIVVSLGLFFSTRAGVRDPERAIPAGDGLVVSPADGKVTSVEATQFNGAPCTRISIFLNVFDVHVNRSPISGVIKNAVYKKGEFGNAMAPQ